MSISTKTIWIMGLGGVGGYVGGRLAKALEQHPGRQQVCFIARGDHLSKIQQQGLQLILHDKKTLVCRPAIATDDLKQLPLPDLIVLAVKSYDLIKALKQIKPFLQTTTIILPLLNGVDVIERCRKILAEAIILPACIYVGVHKQASGIICQQGQENQLIFGPDPSHRELNLTPLKSLLTRAHLNCDEQYNPWPAIWSKYLFIASVGMVTAAYGKSLGDVKEDPSLMHQIRLIMEEVRALALAKELSLPNNIIEVSLNKIKSFPPETKTSFHRDVEIPGHANEADLFGATIIRLGKELNRVTPMTEKIVSLLG